MKLERLSDAELARAAAEHAYAAEAAAHRREHEPFAGMDHEGMPPREELGNAERRAILGVAPRRSRWPELDEIDRRIGELQRRLGEAGQRVQALTEQRANAPQRDADA